MADRSPDLDFRSLHGDALAGKRVLVTGAAGFIGSHVADALVDLGARVIGFDDLSEGDPANIPAGLDLREGNLLVPEHLAAAAEGCEIVFHLAAKVSVPRSVEEPAVYHAVNTTGTLNVLQAAIKNGARRVVYSASSSAYGDQPTLPKHEAMPPAPMSPYASSKLNGEYLLQSYAAVYPIDTVSLRYFNIFGPRQNANSAYAGVIAAFARDLLAGKRPTVFGDGSATRDFTHVGNAVHANLLAATHATPLAGDVFNVGTARRVTVSELAEAMAKWIDRPELSAEHQPPRAGDVPHSLASIDSAKQVLGYEPQVQFEEGLRQTLDWYASRHRQHSTQTAP
ncbi:MAG: NAD-dependent epimerase/dehydratase family protein [Planctomycetota bacterium]